MKIKNIIIAVVIAIIIGVVIGSLIGFISKSLFGPNEPKEPRIESSSSMVDSKKDTKKASDAKTDDKKTTKKSSKKTTDQTEDTANNESTAKKVATQANTNEPVEDGKKTTAKDGKEATISVSGAGLNLRAAADPGSNILGTVSNGTTVTVLGQQNGMVNIRTSDGREAWVAQDFVVQQ